MNLGQRYYFWILILRFRSEYFCPFLIIFPSRYQLFHSLYHYLTLFLEFLMFYFVFILIKIYIEDIQLTITVDQKVKYKKLVRLRHKLWRFSVIYSSFYNLCRLLRVLCSQILFADLEKFLNHHHVILVQLIRLHMIHFSLKFITIIFLTCK